MHLPYAARLSDDLCRVEIRAHLVSCPCVVLVKTPIRSVHVCEKTRTRELIKVTDS